MQAKKINGTDANGWHKPLFRPEPKKRRKPAYVLAGGRKQETLVRLPAVYTVVEREDVQT